MGWLEKMRIDCLERTFAWLDWVARRRGRTADLPAHLATGVSGESAAHFYLRRKGYFVVAGRWSSRRQRGDLDLIAWKGPLLCFIEVKTRTAHDMAPAEVAVDSHKRKIVRRLARLYLRQLPMKTRPPIRFDILSVYIVPGKEKEFVHFEGAFGWSERHDRDRWDDWR
jgi:putative endonuclease